MKNPNNGLELVEALLMDNNIGILSSEYSLNNIKSKYNKNVYFRDTYDGSELVIKNKDGLSLAGKGLNSSKIFISPSYGAILNLETCTRINISSISMGHWPEKGECDGAVITFTDCKDVKLTSLDLFGCGTEGIVLNNCMDFMIDSCIIRECVYGITTTYDCENIVFKNCIFENNLSTKISIGHSNNIIFDHCIFRNNEKSEYFDDYIFSIFDSCGEIKLISCDMDYSNIIEKEKSDLITII